MHEVVPVINPGSTSTKIALWTRDEALFEKNIAHPSEELSRFNKVTEQFDLRYGAVVNEFEQAGLTDHKVVAVASRGARLKPLEGGSYLVNELMLDELRACKYSNHAGNLGALIASRLAEKHNVRAYIVDPITLDNFIPEARISGVPEISRECRSHALNIKANAREVAEELGRAFDECNFIVVHMGGGISVAALRKGLIIDVNDALLGMGPFSAERAGALPIGALVKLCYSGEYSEGELIARLSRDAGLKGYLGTPDLQEVEKMIAEGNEDAREIFEAMAYQIAKEIGAMSSVLKGRLDGVIFTGGMAKSRMLLDEIETYVPHLARIFERPGELEMKALAAGVFRVIDEKESPKEYV